MKMAHHVKHHCLLAIHKSETYSLKKLDRPYERSIAFTLLETLHVFTHHSIFMPTAFQTIMFIWCGTASHVSHSCVYKIMLQITWHVATQENDCYQTVLYVTPTWSPWILYLLLSLSDFCGVRFL